ncbi:MAG: lipopolysaccharide biosynthesis protein [Allosphingosinicella sp.]|uniref:lipopolysaccharide biosynthesis protein n=1 Tax=Allosphingosinicella sp. TaxID=2823234 RepID=UPI003948C21C
MVRPPAVTRGEVAKGAGLAGLARLGAAIELLAQPLYIWLFGLATYGIYVVLWAAVNLVTNLIDLSMNFALQRIVPTAGDEARAHGAVKAALLVTVGPAMLIALLVSLNAGAVAGIFSAAPEDEARLGTAVALFVWALPLWTFVEVATSAARARRAFGPEIRLRIFWEQVARILFALGFFALGLGSLGLMLAHLASLALTAALCVPLLARFYYLRLLVTAPVGGAPLRDLIGTGAALVPANLSRRMLIDAPPVVLNLLLPGAQGAAAAGLFEIARKLSTLPNIVRQSFQYVLAPLASAQAHADRAQIGAIYSFSSRISTALVVPLAGLLAFAGRDVLSVYRPEAMAALPLLYVLVAARAVEAAAAPASTIVEMTGHRGLPLLNSLIGAAVWALLALWLVPGMGTLGMAIAVAVATVAMPWAAAIELKASDGLSPFDRPVLKCLLIALPGVGLMGLTEYLTGGPLRFAVVHLIWGATTWLTLRHGLPREDREALGAFARKLRLV